MNACLSFFSSFSSFIVFFEILLPLLTVVRTLFCSSSSSLYSAYSSSQSLTTSKGNFLSAFSLFVDDHCGSVTQVDPISSFLHEEYFPKAAFEPVHLCGREAFMFTSSLKVVGFISGTKYEAWCGFHSVAKHSSNQCVFSNTLLMYYNVRQNLQVALW